MSSATKLSPIAESAQRETSVANTLPRIANNRKRTAANRLLNSQSHHPSAALPTQTLRILTTSPAKRLPQTPSYGNSTSPTPAQQSPLLAPTQLTLACGPRPSQP
jgi:hypothetical protein